MFIHTSRHGELFFVTITTEVPDSSEGSTATFRFGWEDATFLCQQLAQELTDFHVENDERKEADRLDDTFEKAAALDEYYHGQLEENHDDKFANEPF